MHFIITTRSLLFYFSLLKGWKQLADKDKGGREPDLDKNLITKVAAW
jgi:hypothetical protein